MLLIIRWLGLMIIFQLKKNEHKNQAVSSQTLKFSSVF